MKEKEGLKTLAEKMADLIGQMDAEIASENARKQDFENKNRQKDFEENTKKD